jgi:hypothetical protein
MDTLKLIVGAMATISAIRSGVWWVKAAYAEVKAKGAAGVGYGGTPINVLNANGEAIDFIQSLQLQSRCNSRAALGSAFSAISAAVLFLLNMHLS